MVSTPSRCRLLSPVYISLCFLSLCASSSCLPSQPSVFLAPIFPSLCLFLVLLVSTLACPDSEPACLNTLSVLTTSLPIPLYCFWTRIWFLTPAWPDLETPYCVVLFGLWLGLWTLACPRHAFAYSLCYNQYRSSTICLLCLHLGLALCPYTTSVKTVFYAMRLTQQIRTFSLKC